MFLLAFILWVVAEIAAIVVVAHAIGVLLTILLLIAGWPAGTWLMRAEGRATLRRIRAAVSAGRGVGGADAIDGALAVAAGPLFMIPGFITDVFGLLLLVPVVRHRVGALLARRLGASRRGGGFGTGARRAYDVDSTASSVHRHGPDLDSPQLRG